MGQDNVTVTQAAWKMDSRVVCSERAGPPSRSHHTAKADLAEGTVWVSSCVYGSDSHRHSGQTTPHSSSSILAFLGDPSHILLLHIIRLRPSNQTLQKSKKKQDSCPRAGRGSLPRG